MARSPPSFGPRQPNAKSAHCALTPHAPRLNLEELTAQTGELHKTLTEINRKEIESYKSRLESSLSALKSIQKAAKKPIIRRKQTEIDPLLSRSQSFALISAVEDICRTTKTSENCEWELKFRRKEGEFLRKVEELEENREKAASNCQKEQENPQKLSIDTQNIAVEGGKMSRWPTVTSLSSPQAQLSKLGLVSGERALSSLQRDIRLTSLQMETRESEILSLKLAYESTKRRLEMLELKLEDRERRPDEETAEGSAGVTDRTDWKLQYFQQFYRLKQANAEGKVRRKAKRHAGWLRSFENSLREGTVVWKSS